MQNLELGFFFYDNITELIAGVSAIKCNAGLTSPVRDHVAGISDDEHVTDIGLGEAGRQHPGVYTGHEHCRGHRVVSDSLELLQHVPLPVRPVLHDPVQDLADA